MKFRQFPFYLYLLPRHHYLSSQKIKVIVYYLSHHLYEEAVEAGYDKSIKTFYGIIEGNIWIGPGQNYADVYDNDDYKYENINVNNSLNIECIQDYIYVIYPADSEFMFNLTMSGFPVSMEPVDTTTIQDYYILKSVNQYDGNFNITI